MKLKFLLIPMLVAAMGPGRDAPPPDPQALPESVTPAERSQPVRNPARLPPVSQQEAASETSSSETEMQPVTLEIVDAASVDPAQFLWTARPIVVFADTPGDPALTEQLRLLNDGAAMLVQRDVVVITDTDPAANGVWRRQLRPSGFSLVIMDKDGQVKQRKPFPWSVREIARAIDRFPLRRQELGRASVVP
ncbi:MAG: DUF4174 domain-containing protein [Paracoccus sp. (in: a-proteobacteria)]|nr:DUF4174 domain-containing protein [Paracoccus sp. (in: a-proteobacteria)]